MRRRCSRGRREGLLDTTNASEIDYYLMLTGPGNASVMRRRETVKERGEPTSLRSLYLLQLHRVDRVEPLRRRVVLLAGVQADEMRPGGPVGEHLLDGAERLPGPRGLLRNQHHRHARRQSRVHAGGNLLAVRAHDYGGGTFVDVQVTYNLDTTPPTLTGVPANQIVEATGPAGAAVSWTPPTATDAIDPHPTWSTGPWPSAATTRPAPGSDSAPPLGDRGVVEHILDAHGVNADTVFARIDSGAALATIRTEHEQFARSHNVWGCRPSSPAIRRPLSTSCTEPRSAQT
jgi:hypothetical protein